MTPNVLVINGIQFFFLCKQVSIHRPLVARIQPAMKIQSLSHPRVFQEPHFIVEHKIIGFEVLKCVNTALQRMGTVAKCRAPNVYTTFAL